MSDESSSAKSNADSHFKTLKAEKTATASKQINIDRVKADSDKTARLKAARLAKAGEGKSKNES